MNQTFLIYSNLANGHLPSIRTVDLDQYIVWASVGLYLKPPIVTSWQHSCEWVAYVTRPIYGNGHPTLENRRLMLASIFCLHSKLCGFSFDKNKI